MKSILYKVLSVRNKHPHDDFINFFEEGHQYTITCDPNTKYTSVTSWNHSHFPHFDSDIIIAKMMKGKNWKEGHKYWGMTTEQIKEKWNTNKNLVSVAGTNLHFEIECFMNESKISQEYFHKDLYEHYMSLNTETDEKALEWQYFINFIKDTQYLKPYRTEWTIFNDELKIAGSIDMVYENLDGTLSIYDWKRVKDISTVNYFNRYALTESICHIPDSNFWHYALQLNTYKAILEEKYGKTVTDLYLVRLHPDAVEKNYELIKIPNLQKEISILFEERKKQITFENA